MSRYDESKEGGWYRLRALVRRSLSLNPSARPRADEVVTYLTDLLDGFPTLL